MRTANDNREPGSVRQDRLLAVGEGGGRIAYAKLLGAGFDASATEIVVYGLAEGFSRATGEPAGDPRRFHEHIHRDVGADLPSGLTVDILVGEATAVLRGDYGPLSGMTREDMVQAAILHGRSLATPDRDP